MLARENSDVDNGWLCDRGRFSYPSLYAPDRIVTVQQRLHRARPAGNRPQVEISLEGATEWLHDQLTDGTPALWVLSGNETLEEAYAITRIAAATQGRVVAVPGGSAAAPENAATIVDVERARHILVVGDADLTEIAPILDLRVRKAVRNGASLTTAGIGGARLDVLADRHEHVAPGEFDSYIDRFCEGMRAAGGGQPLTEPGVVIYRDGELSQAAIDRLTSDLQLERDGCGLVAIPAAANARGLATLDIESVGAEALENAEGGIVLVNVDPDRHFAAARWWPALNRAKWVAAIDAFPNAAHDICDLVIPASGYQEKNGTSVNLEGRLQRVNAAGTLPETMKAELTWLAGLARRLGEVVPGNAGGVFRVAAAHLGSRLPVSALGEIPDDGILGVTGGPAPLPVGAGAPTAHDQLTLFVSPFLYDGGDVDRTERMQFLKTELGRLTLARDDARAMGIARGDEVSVTFGDTTAVARVAISKRVAPGYARMFEGTCGIAGGTQGYHAATITKIAAAAGDEAALAAATATPAITGTDAGEDS
jgi:NADH-quinone oxidoreductase subunit G